MAKQPVLSADGKAREVTLKLAADGRSLVIDAPGALGDIDPALVRQLVDLGFDMDGGHLISKHRVESSFPHAAQAEPAQSATPPQRGPDFVPDNRRKLESMPAIMPRWFDMAAYGMKLKLAADDDHRWYLLEGGGKDPELAKALGFAATDDGWVMFGEHIVPAAIRAAAPLAELRPFLRDDMLDTSRMSTPPVFKVRPLQLSTTPLKATVADMRTALGNRNKVEAFPAVFENWIDLSASGMTVKVAADDMRKWFTLEGGDNDPALARRLGFVHGDDGWVLNHAGMDSSSWSFYPARIYGELFMDNNPNSPRRSFFREDVVDVSRMSTPPDYTDVSTPRLPEASTPDSFLAVRLNRRQIEGTSPQFNAWMDLSSYGMAFKIVFADETYWYGLEGGDTHPEIAEKLGFARDGDGEWVRAREQHLPDVKTVRAAAPEMQQRKTLREDVIDVSRMSTPPVFTRAAVKPVEETPSPETPAPRP